MDHVAVDELDDLVMFHSLDPVEIEPEETRADRLSHFLLRQIGKTMLKKDHPQALRGLLYELMPRDPAGREELRMLVQRLRMASEICLEAENLARMMS